MRLDVSLADLDHLRDLDEITYLRFASVYRAFTDFEDFEAEALEPRLDDPPAPPPPPGASRATYPARTSGHEPIGERT